MIRKSTPADVRDSRFISVNNININFKYYNKNIIRVNHSIICMRVQNLRTQRLSRKPFSAPERVFLVSWVSSERSRPRHIGFGRTGPRSRGRPRRRRLGRGLQGQRPALDQLFPRFAWFRQAQRVMNQHQHAHLDQRQRHPEAGKTPQAAMGLQIANPGARRADDEFLYSAFGLRRLHAPDATR